MHGWISLPLSWQLAVLVFAAPIGAALGSVRDRKNGVALWLGFSLAYAIFAVLVAFYYESWRSPGGYDVIAWSILIVPAVALVLPIMGVPWAIASAIVSKRQPLNADRPSSGFNRVEILGAVSLLVGMTVLAVFLQNGRAPRLSSSYQVKPIDRASAPADLSEITAGSEWSCVVLREGQPSSSSIDYHFSPISGDARWQTFGHQNNKRPFFDLAHAAGLDEFFAGGYHVEDGKLMLTNDVAGRSLDFMSKGAMKIDAEGLRSLRDPRLRGEIFLNKNSWDGVFDTISVRSLSPDAMSIVSEIINNGPRSIELTCSRVRDPSFQPVVLLDQIAH